jgi:hypothetical protein
LQIRDVYESLAASDSSMYIAVTCGLGLHLVIWLRDTTRQLQERV